MAEEDDPFEGADAPTEPQDWVGAAIVRPKAPRNQISRSPMMFHVFRASNDHSLFGVTNEQDVEKLPPCPKNGEWQFFKKFPETGHPRIGFSEKDARADIEKQGYHLNCVDIEVGESTISSVAS